MSVCRQSRPRKTRASMEAYGWRTPRALRGSSIWAKASSNVEMGAAIRDQASGVRQSKLGSRLHHGGGTLQSSWIPQQEDCKVPLLKASMPLGPLALAAICGACVRFEPPSGRRDTHLAAPACSPGIMQWRAAASRSAGPPQSSRPPKARDVTHLPMAAM